jgi:hypothetical protein
MTLINLIICNKFIGGPWSLMGGLYLSNNFSQHFTDFTKNIPVIVRKREGILDVSRQQWGLNELDF